MVSLELPVFSHRLESNLHETLGSLFKTERYLNFIFFCIFTAGSAKKKIKKNNQEGDKFYLDEGMNSAVTMVVENINYSRE